MRWRSVIKYAVLLAVAALAAVFVLLLRTDFDSYRPLVAEKVKQATGRDFEIAGAFKLNISWSPAIIIEDVRLQNAVFGTRAEMIKARRLEADVALLPLLLGRIEIGHLTLIGPDILLETDEQGRSNWDFSSEDDPAPVVQPASAKWAALDLPHLGAVTIENGLLTYRNAVNGKTTKIEVVKFTGWSQTRHAPLEIDLAAAYDGVPFRMTGRLGPVTALGSPGAFPVDVKADLADTEIVLRGSVSRPLSPTAADFSIDANSSDVKWLGDILKVSVPARPMSLSGKVKMKDQLVTVTDVRGKLGGSELAGAAQLDLRRARPFISVSVTGPNLDLADFTIAEVPGENGRSHNGGRTESGTAQAKSVTVPAIVDDGRLFSDEPLPIAGLNALDGKFEARVDKLVLGRTTLEQLSLSAALQDGHLTIEPVTGVLAQGEVIGAVALDATADPTAKLRLQIDKLDLKILTQTLEMENIFDGKIDVATSVTGQGTSVRAFMSNLNGKASVIMGKAEVKSSYVDLLGADLLRFAASAGGGAETTQVNCLVSRFDIAKGLAHGRDILFDTSAMTVKGEGNVNLASERLALKFTPRPKEMSIVNLATPWRVEGALQSPQVFPDEAGLAARAAGALLTTVTPLALLVPLVTSAGNDKNPCLAALEPQKQSRAPAAKPPAKTESGGILGLVESVIPGR